MTRISFDGLFDLMPGTRIFVLPFVYCPNYVVAGQIPVDLDYVGLFQGMVREDYVQICLSSIRKGYITIRAWHSVYTLSDEEWHQFLAMIKIEDSVL